MSRAQQGVTKGLRVSKSLSYHWLRYLNDLELNRGNCFQGDLCFGSSNSC